MVITSAAPTESELAVLNLALPQFVKAHAEPGRVIVTLYAPYRDEATPLMSWWIKPAGAPDFAGDLLSRAVIYLAGRLQTMVREFHARGGPEIGDIVNCGSSSVFALRRGVFSRDEFAVDLEHVYTVDLALWY